MPASIMVEGGGSGSDLDCFSDASKNHLLSRSTIPMFWESVYLVFIIPTPYSPAARGGNLAKIPPNQVIYDFGRGSSVESESE